MQIPTWIQRPCETWFLVLAQAHDPESEEVGDQGFAHTVILFFAASRQELMSAKKQADAEDGAATHIVGAAAAPISRLAAKCKSIGLRGFTD